MPQRLILLNTLKALSKGEYIVQEREGTFFMASQSFVYIIKDHLIRYSCIYEIKKDTHTEFTYYKLSYYGDIELQNGKKWWRALPLFEKIKLRLLVGF